MENYRVRLTKYERYKREKGVVMRCGATYGVLRKLVFCAAFVGMAVAACAQEKAVADSPPKLVWERTFERDIVAVGVDDERFPRTSGDITTCLKWILFKGWQLRWLGRSGVVMRVPVRGEVSHFLISSSGKYFVARHDVGNLPRRRWWKPWEGTYYQLYDWNGRNMWVTKGESSSPWFVWNDGSSVFVERVWHPDNVVVRGLTFLDAWGRAAGTYRFPEPRVPPCYSSVNTSSNLFAIGLTPQARFEEKGQEIYVFRKDGRLVWKKEHLKRWVTHPRFGKVRCMLRELTVSDRGDVFALFACYAPPFGYEVLIYDEEGNSRDSLSLRPSGGAVLVRIQGNLAFLTTRGCDVEGRWGWSRFLCYDVESMRTRFLLTEDHDYHFGSFDVDEEAGLIAVAVYEKRGRDAIRIYDLWGTYETELRVDISRRNDSWFKLLDGTLLVAEKNKLRLYEIDVE